MTLQSQIYANRRAAVGKADPSPIDEVIETALKNAEARATKIITSKEAIGRETSARTLAALPEISADKAIQMLSGMQRSQHSNAAANRSTYKF